jgi:hypothetical protein
VSHACPLDKFFRPDPACFVAEAHLDIRYVKVCSSRLWKLRDTSSLSKTAPSLLPFAYRRFIWIADGSTSTASEYSIAVSSERRVPCLFGPSRSFQQPLCRCCRCRAQKPYALPDPSRKCTDKAHVAAAIVGSIVA